jgi:hypothetical protein
MRLNLTFNKKSLGLMIISTILRSCRVLSKAEGDFAGDSDLYRLAVLVFGTETVAR